MNNIAKVKNKVKAHLKNEDIKQTSFFTINFDNVANETDINIYKLTKNQYLQTELSNLVKKEDLKFPLKFKRFDSKDSIEKAISIEKKNSRNLIKINNYLTLGQKTMQSFSTNLDTRYYKFNNTILGIIKLIRIFKFVTKENLSK